MALGPKRPLFKGQKVLNDVEKTQTNRKIKDRKMEDPLCVHGNPHEDIDAMLK